MVFLPFALFGATAGKIAGRVVDRATGEPLAGVNVIVDDPSLVLGAATDVDGYYSILNVPVGGYKIRTTYIGYKDYVIQNVRVSVDLTTEVNFEMEQTALEFEEVLVTAVRPMIRKDETNTNIIRTAEEINNMPIRGMQQIISTTAGVVKDDNSLVMNVRGGRGGETAMYVDGVLVNDPYNKAVRVYLPNEAIEEMSVQTGGFNAEYGDAMSGIIAVTTNVGGERYNASVQAITDEFLAADKKMLGTYSYGYNEYIFSLSGPVIPKTKHTFFISGTRRYIADAWPSWGWAENADKLDVFNYDQILTVGYDSLNNPIRDTLTHNYDFSARIPKNQSSEWSWTGKLKLQLGKNMTLKSSFVRTDRTFGNMNPIQLFNASHTAETRDYSQSINVTLTHSLSQNTFYDLKLNLFDTERKIYDPVFGDNLEMYGDPDYNPYPDRSVTNQYVGEAYTRRIYSSLKFDFFEPGSQYDDYFKNRTTYWAIDFDLVHQYGKYHSLRAGFEYKYHTLREIRFLSPVRLAKTYGTELEKYQNADVRFYGYTIDGEESDEGDFFNDVTRAADGTLLSGYKSQAPYHPIIMSWYVQDKVEFRDLVLNIGMRYDHVNPNAWQFRELDATFDANGVYVDGTGMFGGNRQFDKSDVKDSESYSFISPRLGMSFPVTDRTVFHAQYGKFYQAPDLADLYLSPFYLDAFVNRGGYFTTLDNPNLRPPKTTAYEIGFRQRLSDYASLQMTAFYKETEDLVQVLNVTTDVTNIAFSMNGDYGNVKGFDFIFNLRRYKNLSATFNYEMQFAHGTGSATGSNFDIAWQGGARGNFPKFAMPLDFEQRHTGSLNLDYRFGRDDGPIYLQNTGVNLLFQFNSGQPYTLMALSNSFPFDGRYDNDRISAKPVSPVNSQASPWVFRLDMKIDRKFYIGSTMLTAYVSVNNLLNSENVRAVWITTGLPDDTGYRQTAAGRLDWARYSDTEKSLFRMREVDFNNFGTPRQIRLGVQVEI